MNIGANFDKEAFNAFLKRNKKTLNLDDLIKKMPPGKGFGPGRVLTTESFEEEEEITPSFGSVTGIAKTAISGGFGPGNKIKQKSFEEETKEGKKAPELTNAQVAKVRVNKPKGVESVSDKPTLDDDEEMTLTEKAIAKTGKIIANDARKAVSNLRANYNMKHKGSLEELQNILKKSATKRDWALSQMAYYDDAFENLETEHWDRWSNVAEKHHEAKMHHIDPTNPEAGAVHPKNKNRNLRIIEMFDSKTGDVTIAFAGLGKGVEDLMIAGRPADVAFTKADFAYGTKGKVSKPILEIYENLRPTMLEILGKYDGKVKFVGHSLGGALAEMAGADKHLGVKNVSVTAFAPPPFADADFVNSYPEINLNRFGNRYDPVMFKLGFGARHPTNEMWDITHFDSKLVNDKFWWNPLGHGDELVKMTHQTAGMEKGFVEAMFDPELLEDIGRQKGDSIFSSKITTFLDSLDLGLRATGENAFAALKEFFKASGGDTPYFKGLFSGDGMEKVADVINLDNIKLDLADFDVIDASDINVFDDITQIPDLEDMDLDDILKKVGGVVDDLETAPLLEGIKISDRVTPITNPVLKKVGIAVNKSPVLAASRNVVKQMAKRAKDAKGVFLGTSKTAAKAAKGITKGFLKGLGKAIDVGVLDAVFVGIDIAEDTKRIDDESVFTMWNGVPVHKLYSPEEYAYIEALKVIYNLQAIHELGVSVDNFINTWFGRISEGEDGTFLIDGEDKGGDYLRNGFEYLSSSQASSEGVRTESKTSSTAKNITKGVFGFLIGAAIFTAAAIAAPATGGGSLVAAGAVYAAATAATVGASVAIEAIDDHYELSAIEQRANNFNQAFHRKLLNDHLDVLNSKIVEVFGPLLQADHSVVWHKELLNAALIEKHPGALGQLEGFGYPRDIIESIGKIVRSHIPRINDMKITSETKLTDIMDHVTNKVNYMSTYLAGDFKIQRELNATLDEIYEDLRGDLNGDLNRLWEMMTDRESGLSKEEIEAIAKKANEIIDLEHKHSRKDRNEMLKEAGEDLDDLIKSTEEKIEDRSDLQAEIDKLNEQLKKAKGKLDDERTKLEESASDLEKIVENLKLGGAEISDARDALEKARGDLEDARDDIIEARGGLIEDQETLIQAITDFNKERREFFEMRVAEQEKEFNEVLAREKERIENVRVRRESRREEQSKGEEGLVLNAGKIEENVDIDRGLPEREDEGRFEPTGKELAFTFDGGAPRMLFETGEEKSYTGPSNALAGGITQGHWTGVIPNADKPPVNLLDNYFMAYHIENQEDQTLANGRLIKRITRALNKKKITPESNPIEYRVALITLEHIKRYKNIFGIEISNSFMENGLGAIIRDQVYENITVPLRKGALPVSFSLGEENLEMEIDADARVNLKRARDVAFAGGDKMMGAKFQRVYADFNDMARVAGEYLGEAKRLSEGGNISGGMERLVLENLQKVEQKEEGIAKLLVSLLNKPLIQVIGK